MAGSQEGVSRKGFHVDLVLGKAGAGEAGSGSNLQGLPHPALERGDPDRPGPCDQLSFQPELNQSWPTQAVFAQTQSNKNTHTQLPSLFNTPPVILALNPETSKQRQESRKRTRSAKQKPRTGPIGFFGRAEHSSPTPAASGSSYREAWSTRRAVCIVKRTWGEGGGRGEIKAMQAVFSVWGQPVLFSYLQLPRPHRKESMEDGSSVPGTQKELLEPQLAKKLQLAL
uniref:Uncharacterized protein n=1 Tax=Sphaerodactylus townsendi TaxID=933632 RepID=A0ACB8FKY0_9SAUR